MATKTYGSDDNIPCNDRIDNDISTVYSVPWVTKPFVHTNRIVRLIVAEADFQWKVSATYNVVNIQLVDTFPDFANNMQDF